jgi:hypothetical protein
MGVGTKSRIGTELGGHAVSLVSWPLAVSNNGECSYSYAE